MNNLKTYSFSGIGPRIDMQDMGLFRKIPDKPIAWCIVCDGMGGQPGGEEAARICIQEYDDYFLTSKAQAFVKNTSDFIRLGMLPVLDTFYSHIENNQEHFFMGCTLAMFFLDRGTAYFSWCGDARIYLFRNGKIHYKSLPHNPVFDDYRAGKIKLREAEKKVTNIITRAVSAGDAFPVLENKRINVYPGDRILVCTDGVWSTLRQNDYKELANSLNLDKTIYQIDNYLKTNAKDNYLGWLVEI